MSQPIVKFKKNHPDAVIPQYKTNGSAGMDLHFIIPDNYSERILRPRQPVLLSTGLNVEISEGYEGQVRSRSGLALKGVVVANSPGTIDSDYRGPLGVILVNISPESITISHLDRIAQLVIAPVSKAIIEEVTKLSETERGEKGFGSTGVK